MRGAHAWRAAAARARPASGGRILVVAVVVVAVVVVDQPSLNGVAPSQRCNHARRPARALPLPRARTHLLSVRRSQEARSTRAPCPGQGCSARPLTVSPHARTHAYTCTCSHHTLMHHRPARLQSP